VLTIRNAEPADREGIFALINRTFRQNYHPTMQYEFPLLFSGNNLHRVFIALDDERIVSHMGYQNTVCQVKSGIYEIGFLGAVATYPEYRGNGIASTLLKKAEASMREQGIHICLISGNRGLYTSSGYQEAGKTEEYEFSPDEDRRNYGEYRIDAYTEEECALFFEIYASERTHFMRTFSQFETLLGVYDTVKKTGSASTPIAQIGPAFLVKDGSEPKAYFVLRGNGTYVIEYAGDRGILVKAWQQYVQSTGNSLKIRVPESDKQLKECLLNDKMKKTEEYFFPPHHTAKAIQESVDMISVLKELPLPGLNYV
jgi:predicted N-acetyltransferase YhbS